MVLIMGEIVVRRFGGGVEDLSDSFINYGDSSFDNSFSSVSLRLFFVVLCYSLVYILDKDLESVNNG